MIAGNLLALVTEITDATIGDANFIGVTTDSRNVKAGQLFVAVRGEQFDGHHF
jgi:UDP-N-acetylmuramoyl-tripeptide--D-alanyl-D-alanine ligase